MSEKLNILVVEDNPGDAKLIHIYLKQSRIPHNYFHSTNLSGAVEIVQKENITIVLLDLGLPDSSTLETLNSFESKFKKLPVVLMTGHKEEGIVERAIKMGAQDFLVKNSFDSELLGRVIRWSLQRHKKQIHLEEIERKLTITQARAQEAEKLAGAGRWEIDIVTNKMNWSDMVFKIFGFSPGMISPTLGDYLSYIHLEDRKMVNQTIEQASKDGEPHKIEYRIIIDGTKIKYLANQFQVSYDELTHKTLLVGAIQDITEQKQAQRLLAEKRITEKTSKIKEELLEDLSFQIRTPLSSIFSFSYLLDTPELQSGQRENLSALQNSVDDLSIAINNMLNFSLLLSEKIKVEEKTIKLDDILVNLQRLVKVKSNNKNISLDINLPKEELPPVVGDENKINQILFNVIDNAIKYTDSGGAVSLSIMKVSETDEEIEVKVIANDNGAGIDDQLLKKLLESNLLIQEEEGNKQGLGIPIMKRLIETMNGDFDIKSEVGKGTEVSIRLSLKKATIAKVQKEGKPVSPVKILFVEDHFLNQISTSNILKRWSDHISIDIADNGQIGVDMFLENNDYDLVLMDLQMPVMGGIEAAVRIREESEVPIIALSANTSKQEAENCSKSGMNDYLAKPFQPNDLFSRIMSVLYEEV